jgi:large subunit ribosomal protein L25
MSDNIKLAALSRNSAQADKTKHYILAEVYGPDAPNQHVMVENIAFQKTFAKAGVSTLLDLEIDGKETVQVITREIQYHPLKGNPIHIDFYQVNPKQKLTTKINLVTVGVSAAVQNMGGILMKNLEELTIECLPNDLISQIDVDLSKLATLKDTIRVEDLTVPANLTIKNDPRAVVASVLTARKQKIAATTTDTAVATPAAGAPTEGAKPAVAAKKADAKKK